MIAAITIRQHGSGRLATIVLYLRMGFNVQYEGNEAPKDKKDCAKFWMIQVIREQSSGLKQVSECVDPDEKGDLDDAVMLPIVDPLDPSKERRDEE